MTQELLAPDGTTSLRAYVGNNSHGGYTGAGRGYGNQLANWNAPNLSADAALLPHLKRAQARSDDLVRNNGIAKNAVQLHLDHIVGENFRLSWKPNWRVLGIKEDQELVKDVEALFAMIADSERCLLDAEGKRTFTMMIRAGVEMHCTSGEILGKPEWLNENNRDFHTAIKLVSPKRLSNPQGKSDTEKLRAGIEVTASNAATHYHIAVGGDRYNRPTNWRRIPRYLKGGRRGMIHIFEPREPDQTRGANEFLAVMEQMKMLDTLQNTKLQNAIVGAMYAATIESELDSEQAFEYIAGAAGSEQNDSPLEKVLGMYGDYYAGNNIKLGGVKVPHLFPGDRLKLMSPANADNGFSQLEQSLMRYISAGTGYSYEELSHNYQQLSYSTARASANNSWRYTMGRRRLIANRLANQIFELFLEEAIIRGWIKLPNKARFNFWEMREAWCRCEWIGSGRMAIDGLKEVREAIMKIEYGLSTYEIELAKMGHDYVEIFKQQKREMEERKKENLPKAIWMPEEVNNEELKEAA